MQLIEQDELEAYHAVLARFGLRGNDFDLSETDTSLTENATYDAAHL
jgi:hypothetical protein